jgi:hypothetical protein
MILQPTRATEAATFRVVMAEKRRALFRTLNGLVAALVVIVGAWLVLESAILLLGATIAAVGTAAILLCRQLGSDGS